MNLDHAIARTRIPVTSCYEARPKLSVGCSGSVCPLIGQASGISQLEAAEAVARLTRVGQLWVVSYANQPRTRANLFYFEISLRQARPLWRRLSMFHTSIYLMNVDSTDHCQEYNQQSILSHIPQLDH
jgi:hypothetical protein